MASHRIRIARDKAELVQALLDSSGTSGLFQTYADVMIFAASLGAQQGKRVPLESIAKEPSPISLEIFISRGYDALIKLLALVETQDRSSISAYQLDAEELRVQILEEYANGGLEKLQEELRGARDYAERILLILGTERSPRVAANADFDLSRFL
jgi:dnd system-associated protein 4